MIFKKIKYAIYMINLRLKGFTYSKILKRDGFDVASYYVKDTARAWSKYTLDMVGIKVDVHGLENIPSQPCVFIGNHSSILDIPLILHTVDKRIGFIAKKELSDTPVIGYWINRSGSVFIDRENPKEAIKAINKGVENIKNGYSMAIFPEGTRAKNGTVGEFKKGSLKLATKSKVPIVPVSIDRASRAYEDSGKFTPTNIRVVYGEPIYTDSISKEEERTLMDKVRSIIIENLG